MRSENVPAAMSREHLRRATQHLEAAAETAQGTTAERLREQAEQFRRLAERERGPDHGRLARHERVVADIADEGSDDVEDHVEDALEAVHAFRETIEGV
jgi:hypothetical protein